MPHHEEMAGEEELFLSFPPLYCAGKAWREGNLVLTFSTPQKTKGRSRSNANMGIKCIEIASDNKIGSSDRQ